MIDTWRATNKLYATFDIHRRIVDPNFLKFDPTSYSTKTKTKGGYDVIYGQSLLNQLLLVQDPVLHEFVVDTIEKIIELAEDEMIAPHYTYFADTFELYHRQEGGAGAATGGVRRPVSNAYIQPICEYLAHYLRSGGSYETSELYFAPTRYILSDYKMCERVIEHLIVRYGAVVPTYIEYLRSRGKSYWTDTQTELVNQFLKRRNGSENQTPHRNTRRYVKAGRRKQRRTRRQPKQHQHQ